MLTGPPAAGDLCTCLTVCTEYSELCNLKHVHLKNYLCICKTYGKRVDLIVRKQIVLYGFVTIFGTN